MLQSCNTSEQLASNVLAFTKILLSNECQHKTIVTLGQGESHRTLVSRALVIMKIHEIQLFYTKEPLKARHMTVSTKM